MSNDNIINNIYSANHIGICYCPCLFSADVTRSLNDLVVK